MIERLWLKSHPSQVVVSERVPCYRLSDIIDKTDIFAVI